MLSATIGGRYKIVQKLGGGGFGETYIAEDLQLPDRARCVVKQLKPQSSDPFVMQTARRLFETEARVLHVLGKHDRIPQLLAHFEEEQEFYLVQELIEGNDLAAELTRPIAEPQVIALLLDVLEILEFVHQQNVVHRDLKPANLIRRRQDGRLVLIDFGAVKQLRCQLENPQQLTSATVAIGTPGYMPSEQLSGRPRPCSDIYALGAIAIQALTGTPPHQFCEDPQTGELAWEHLTSVSPSLAAIVDRMVRYDFRQRYQSAAEVIDALRGLYAPSADTEISVPANGTGTSNSSTPTVAVTPSLPSQPPSRQFHFPWKILLGISGTVAIAAAVAFNLSKSTAVVKLEPTPTLEVTPTKTPPTAKATAPDIKPTVPIESPVGNTQRPIEPSEVNSPARNPILGTAYAFLSERPLEKIDLVGKSDIELDVMRNEVFARYGRRFKDPELQNYFSKQSWYRPVYDPDKFPDNLLTPIEKQNVQFILAHQKMREQAPEPDDCNSANSSYTRAAGDPTSSLNVRRGPGTEFAIAGKIDYGTVLKVASEQRGWLQITSPLQGWVAKNRTYCPG